LKLTLSNRFISEHSAEPSQQFPFQAFQHGYSLLIEYYIRKREMCKGLRRKSQIIRILEWRIFYEK